MGFLKNIIKDTKSRVSNNSVPAGVFPDGLGVDLLNYRPDANRTIGKSTQRDAVSLLSSTEKTIAHDNRIVHDKNIDNKIVKNKKEYSIDAVKGGYDSSDKFNNSLSMSDEAVGGSGSMDLNEQVADMSGGTKIPVADESYIKDELGHPGTQNSSAGMSSGSFSEGPVSSSESKDGIFSLIKSDSHRLRKSGSNDDKSSALTDLSEGVAEFLNDNDGRRQKGPIEPTGLPPDSFSENKNGFYKFSDPERQINVSSSTGSIQPDTINQKSEAIKTNPDKINNKYFSTRDFSEKPDKRDPNLKNINRTGENVLSENDSQPGPIIKPVIESVIDPVIDQVIDLAVKKTGTSKNSKISYDIVKPDASHIKFPDLPASNEERKTAYIEAQGFTIASKNAGTAVKRILVQNNNKEMERVFKDYNAIKKANRPIPAPQQTGISTSHQHYNYNTENIGQDQKPRNPELLIRSKDYLKSKTEKIHIGQIDVVVETSEPHAPAITAGRADKHQAIMGPANTRIASRHYLRRI